MKVYLNAFLFNNLGDDLFVDVITKRYPKTQFYTISNYFKSKTKNLKVFSNKYINKILTRECIKKNFIIKKCDFIVSIGGSMYIEGKSKSKVKEFEGKDYYIIGSNFGPYETKEYYEEMYKFFEKAKDVSFREEYSYNLFKELSNVRYEPDLLFSLNTENIKITNRKRVIISVISCKMKTGQEEEKYQSKIIELIEFFNKKGYEICLMSFCQIEGDEKAVNEIKNKTNIKVDTYFYRGNIRRSIKHTCRF